MYLIVNEVMQLKVVHIAYRYTVVERLTGTSVIKLYLTVLIHSGFLEHCADISLMRTVEYRRADLPSECLCSIAEMNLKYLSDVHTGRNAERIKNYIKRSTVR